MDQQEYRKKRNEKALRHILANPEKASARLQVRCAMALGILVRRPCACGSEKSEAHHSDYSKPLEVEWMCRPCHNREHHGEFCKNGHPRTKENTYVYTRGGYRAQACRPCDTEKKRRKRSKHRVDSVSAP
jgi:hypothetical protein